MICGSGSAPKTKTSCRTVQIEPTREGDWSLAFLLSLPACFPFDSPKACVILRLPKSTAGEHQLVWTASIMALNRSKRYRTASEQVDRSKSYNFPDAVATLKKFPPTKFDQTVTVSFRLGVDPKQSDQMVRGTCPLPHGSGKQVRVLVFAEGAAAKAAKDAGAEYVGFKDMIQKCQEGFQDFDVAVATPAAMAEVRKLGKVLGPRGLMPNPKTGTVTDDTAKAVLEVKAGRVEFKLDKNGNVAVPVGKFSFEEKALVENGNAVIEAVVRARPATAKGRYLEGMTLSATMSPGIHVDPSPYLSV
jgi:large subunit ribosomal protein L1